MNYSSFPRAYWTYRGSFALCAASPRRSKNFFILLLPPLPSLFSPPPSDKPIGMIVRTLLLTYPWFHLGREQKRQCREVVFLLLPFPFPSFLPPKVEKVTRAFAPPCPLLAQPPNKKKIFPLLRLAPKKVLLHSSLLFPLLGGERETGSSRSMSSLFFFFDGLGRMIAFPPTSYHDKIIRPPSPPLVRGEYELMSFFFLSFLIPESPIG